MRHTADSKIVLFVSKSINMKARGNVALIRKHNQELEKV